jgi:peroxiredoxin
MDLKRNNTLLLYLKNQTIMKIFIILLFIAFLYPSTQAQVNTTVQGTLPDLRKGSWVYLYPWLSKVKDSVLAGEGGKFEFRMKTTEGQLYLLQIGSTITAENSLTHITMLYLQPGKIVITGKRQLLRYVDYSGSPYALDFNSYTKIQRSPELLGMDTLSVALSKAYSVNDKGKISALTAAYKKYDSISSVLLKKWIDKHLNSPVAAVPLMMFYESHKMSTAETETYYKKLGPSAKQKNAVADRIINTINAEKNIGIGKMAPEFTQNDTLGKPVSLRSFRGKYLLIDFWASWCGPCRKENPNVIKAYNRFRDKNFTILGVSLDQPNGKEKWLKAIHDDGLTWTQVSDLKGWSNAVAQLYSIKSVPANYLLDPTGKIIAKDLREEELEKKLEELLK